MTRSREGHAALISLLVIGLAYSWSATGVRPFSAPAYTYLAVASLSALVLFGSLGGFSTRDDVRRYYRYRARGTSLKSTAGWIIVALCAVALECVGLALGGRSSSVPTLSTTVDHLLVNHWARTALFFAWLLVGASPLRRLYRAQRRSR